MSRQHAPPAHEKAKASDVLPAARKPEALAKGHGKPLEDSVRAQMESRFGTDFGAVRVHADQTSAASARSLGAAAYTIGDDIVFGAGRYAPGENSGQALLAHELAHVVQQSRGGSASSDAEARADHAADQVVQGGPVATGALGGAPLGVQAKPDDNAPVDAGMVFPVGTFSSFALNSGRLTSQHTQDIEKLAWSISLHVGMRKNGRATISVVGHTDRSGDEKHNDTLGQQRADATRQALIDALKKHGIGEEVFGQIESTSLGESSPVVPTDDGVRNEKNRRTEVRVTVASQVVAPPKPPFDPLKPPNIRVDEPEPKPGTGTAPDTGPTPDWWRNAEENQRKIDEFDRKKRGQSKSLSERAIDVVMKVVDPLINKLPVPDKVKELARTGVRKGLEKGSEAACESAIDATGATGAEAEAAKAACKAGLKTKPGELGPP